VAKGKCSVRGCQNPNFAKQLCSAHYKRNQRYGSPTGSAADDPAANNQPEATSTSQNRVSGREGNAKRWVIDRNDIYTQLELSKLLQMTPRHVSEQIGNLRSTGTVNGKLAYSLPETARKIFGIDLSTEDGDDPYAGLKPAERKAVIESQLKYVELQVKLGNYVSTDDLHHFIAEKFKVIDISLSTLPDHIEREVGLSPEQLAIVDREIDKLRVTLTEQEIN